MLSLKSSLDRQTGGDTSRMQKQNFMFDSARSRSKEAVSQFSQQTGANKKKSKKKVADSKHSAGSESDLEDPEEKKKKMHLRPSYQDFM